MYTVCRPCEKGQNRNCAAHLSYKAEIYMLGFMKQKIMQSLNKLNDTLFYISNISNVQVKRHHQND